ncbi:helix-turn-helix domain-containing protein [Holdemania massiliensis]|uniref:helix-turn-helix domain-containing protein n=1 Tax=Holdemania massiliensis TaxID=1468449 RepID=UPI001F064C29|nr:helix-turn-helix domain-containing protein [Holdemania massiliensis]MCH1942343.1 helix-turn-helix domain-containing protein [Holdemania massiliensis]
MNRFFLRNYIELCHLIVNGETDVSSFQAFFDLSNYEMTMDLNNLREIAADFGISLIVNTRKITFEIIDQSRFDMKFRYCRAFYYRHRHSFQSNKDILLQACIGKLLLWSRNSISVETLADTIGYSRSSIRNAVRGAREFVRTFDIWVENVPYYGLKVRGNEFDIRRCFISLYSLFDINIIPSPDNPNILWGYQTETYETIIRMIETVLDQNSYPILNIEKRRLTSYLIIQNARIRAGFPLTKFEHCHEKLLRQVWNLPVYSIAETLLEKLTRELNLGPYDQTEICSAAILLLVANPNIDENVDLVRHFFPESLADLTEQICNYFADNFNLNLIQEPLVDRYLSYALSQIILKYQFNMLMNKATNLGGRDSLTTEYPLLSWLTREVTHLLEDFFQCPVASSQASSLAEILSFSIQLTSLKYHRQKIAIISRTSRMEPTFIKKLIEKEVDHDYYSDLNCLGYNEIVNWQSQQYDLIISDTVTQKFNCKVFPHDVLPYHLNNLNDFIRKNRDLCEDVLHEIVSLPLDLNNRDSVERLFNRIRQQLPPLALSVKDEFVASENYNGRIVTILHHSQIMRNQLIVGNISRKVLRGGVRCFSYIFLIARLDSENMRFFNVLLHELVCENTFLKRLINEPSQQIVNEQMNLILK